MRFYLGFADAACDATSIAGVVGSGLAAFKRGVLVWLLFSIVSAASAQAVWEPATQFSPPSDPRAVAGDFGNTPLKRTITGRAIPEPVADALLAGVIVFGMIHWRRKEWFYPEPRGTGFRG